MSEEGNEIEKKEKNWGLALQITGTIVAIVALFISVFQQCQNLKDAETARIQDKQQFDSQLRQTDSIFKIQLNNSRPVISANNMTLKYEREEGKFMFFSIGFAISNTGDRIATKLTYDMVVLDTAAGTEDKFYLNSYQAADSKSIVSPNDSYKQGFSEILTAIDESRIESKTPVSTFNILLKISFWDEVLKKEDTMVMLYHCKASRKGKLHEYTVGSSNKRKEILTCMYAIAKKHGKDEIVKILENVGYSFKSK